MTSFSFSCAHRVAHRLTKGFRVTIFYLRSVLRMFPDRSGSWLHFPRTTLPRYFWSARMTPKIRSLMSIPSSTSSRA